MVQLVRCLSGKQEDQSLDPQNTYEKLSIVAWSGILALRIRAAKTDRTLQLTGQPD